MRKNIILSTAVAASVILNIYLLVSLSQMPRQTVVPSGKCSIPLQAVTAPPEAQLEECKKRLGGETSLMTIGMVVAGLATRKQEPAETEPVLDAGEVKDAAVGEDGGESGDAGRTPPEDPLCSISRRVLANEWKEKGPDILAAVKKSVSDPEEQEKNVQNEVKRFAETLKLNDYDRQRFEARFRGVRQARETAINEALSEEKPDYRKLIDAARGLFNDTDGLTGELFGDDARKKLSGTEREGRLTVLAIIASIADSPWDEATEGF